MNPEFSLTDSLSLGDLQVYLGRAGRVDDGSARLIASGGVLAVYVGVLYPAGLLDGSPTVLGLRTFALASPVGFDAVVPVRAILDRLVRRRNELVDPTAPVTIDVPPQAAAAAWAAISPPRGGWSPVCSTGAALLETVAGAGIAEVAAAIPTGTGEQIVHRVRAEVWGRPIPGLGQVPAGAAFAALSLGFLGGDDEVRVFETGPWTRLSTPRGHVLVKRKGPSPLG